MVFPMIQDQDDATIDLHCRIGRRYPAKRGHDAMHELLQERMRSRLLDALSTVESELA